jgi:hypothetical protein
MHPVLAKTFRDLSAYYYLRQFFCGLTFPLLILLTTSSGKYHLQMGIAALMMVNTLLYPYSRFVYESVIDFIVGQNEFFVNAALMLVIKLMTMMVCWTCAMIVAPIGLGYFYLHQGDVAH